MSNQAIHLNLERFNKSKNLDIITPLLLKSIRMPGYNYKIEYSYKYNIERPTDKLISFIDSEYFKLTSSLLKMIIELNLNEDPDELIIYDNKIEFLTQDITNPTQSG